MYAGVFLYGDIGLGVDWRRGNICRRDEGPRQDAGGWQKLAFTTIFDGIMDGAGGGGRRYCGESVGAMVCIFGVGGRMCVVVVGRIDASD